MNKDKAEKYLKRKGKWEEGADNQKELDKVMKEGKIYGDPEAEIQW